MAMMSVHIEKKYDNKLSQAHCMTTRIQKMISSARRIGLHVLCLSALAVLMLAGPAPCQELRKATFLPQWSPQAQFAGYYVAHAKGFYARRGIDLEILRGGPDRPAAQALAQEEVEFVTLFLSTGIDLRSNGLEILNIGQIVQRSALALVAKRSSGIRAVKDLDGKAVSIWPDFALQPRAFFRKYNLHVRVAPQGGSISLFLRGGVDAASVMLYNEYHTILNSGLDPAELRVFDFSHYGINFPEDGIYCLEQTLKESPELCRDFVLASIEGWAYALEHTEEALDIVMKHVRAANLPTNRVHQKWMLEHMRDIIMPPGKNIPMGTLLPDEYRFVAKQLMENGIITSMPEYGDFHADLAHAR